MDLNEKTLSSSRIYDGRILNVRVDTVELPDGRVSTREVVEHRGAVAVVPILDTDRIVMVRQFRQPVGEVLLEIPAGTLAPGEDPDDCALRELAEETGYRAGELRKLFSSYLAPGYSSEMLHTYLATGLSKPVLSKVEATEANTDADEFVEIVVVRFSDAVGMISSGEIRDAKTICGVLMAQRVLRDDRIGG